MPIIEIEEEKIPGCSSETTDGENRCVRYAGMDVRMRVFLGEKGSEFSFPEDELPDSIFFEYDGRTGFADLTAIDYLGEASFEVRSALSATLEIEQEPTDNFREDLRCTSDTRQKRSHSMS